MKKSIPISIISLCIKIINADIIIIIHGTWASDSSWSKPGASFFNTLEEKAHKQGHSVIAYTWPGKADNQTRLLAGKSLAKLIESYPNKTRFQIVAHSHGTNVGIIASQLLSKNNQYHHAIRYFYSLAAPIAPDVYFPAMNVIDYFYNFFSFSDFVQPVAGIFSREFPIHQRISNIRLLLCNKEPDHTDFQDENLASWLPHLHDFLHESKDFCMTQPYALNIQSTSSAILFLDKERNRLRRQDERIHQSIMNADNFIRFYKENNQ